MSDLISIYVHIPFCESKCVYCAFTSFCSSKSLQAKYVSKLIEEIKERKTYKQVKSIYFGGGTPSVIDENHIADILKTIKENYLLSDDAEITIETNPNSLSEEKVKYYKAIGINRISLGIQSLNNKSLKKIGRLHTRQQALNAVKICCDYFNNVSVDLILGLEKEKWRKVKSHARKLIKLGVKHISCYMLEVSTKKFEDMINRNLYTPLSDDEIAKVYKNLVNYLEKKSFYQYEISNFAKDGKFSRHNLHYWKVGEYLGFGVAAHSYIDGIRVNNADKLNDYFQGGKFEEQQTRLMLAEEKIMLGLRCDLGVNLLEIKMLGFHFNNAIFKEYLEKDILRQRGELIQLNPKYYIVSNTIITNLIDFEK